LRGSAALPRLALAVLVLSACRQTSTNTIVDVKVELTYRAAEKEIVVLEATVEDANHRSTKEFARPGKPVLEFPVRFGIELAPDVTGPIRIEVNGRDAAGVVRARSEIKAQTITPREITKTTIWLQCPGNCPTDAGADALPPDARADAADQPEAGAPCGNGKIDIGETCDIAIPKGQSGACPPATCDDMLACTKETRIGSDCTAVCVYVEEHNLIANDGCCPAGANHMNDPDCSATCGNGQIEPGEFCDTGVTTGMATACPVAADCPDTNSCTSDILLSAGTCNAICAHREVTTFISGDGCCPAGASHSTDSDCPVVCGNRMVESGESCDTGVAAGAPGACPVPCAKKTACTKEVTDGTGCKAVCREVPITEFLGGDGCCPTGGNRALDPDCPAVCGNGVFEPGEVCDKAIAPGAPGACPTACAPDPGGCMPRSLEGRMEDCTIHCVPTPITMCKAASDGCCPTGCSSANDGDCSATCGNGVVEIAETCDTAIPAGAPGSCPRQCNDGNTCSTDMLLSKDTCNARCQATPITMFANGDGCCPPNGNHNLDSDCPAVCGNGVVEGKETCDPMIAAASPGACPTTCPPPGECKSYALAGETAACTARCEPSAIKACTTGDGCCPSGCNGSTDADCPAVCGNGIVDMGELCDRAITAGMTGACLLTCDDGDPCTTDSTSGSVADCTRSCSHAAVTACTAGDRCCPSGCDGMTDSDCNPVCGNGLVEFRETCDPESSCPTTCPDDGDPCTREELSGQPQSCNATCTHVAIRSCSGSMADQCCPNPGCSANPDDNKFDTDCAFTAGP
jgi:hypothetical protein